MGNVEIYLVMRANTVQFSLDESVQVTNFLNFQQPNNKKNCFTILQSLQRLNNNNLFYVKAKSLIIYLYVANLVAPLLSQKFQTNSFPVWVVCLMPL